ncbi:MAG TPA: FkbM family methyltransferase [Acidobacteriota bacterium]|nr:FkbM family methyltransferase [Acidobacteriota bacterium]
MMQNDGPGARKLKERLDTVASTGSAAGLKARLAKRWPAFTSGILREVAIVGAAGEGQRLAALCARHKIALRGIADDNPVRQGQAVEGRKVTAVDELDGLDRGTPVIVASHRALLPVRRLRNLGFTNVAPFLLLQELDPVRFPPHMFHDGLLEDLVRNLERYRQLSKIVADDHSRAVLAAVIDYRLNADPEVLDPIVEWDLYGPSKLLKYGTNEVYVDGGAYDGDSVRLFIKRVENRFDKVIAFEPDPATFDRLKANFANEPRVHTVKAGLHRAKATLNFDSAGTRGSVLTKTGSTAVPVVGLDEVLYGERVTYVKLNIEGAEIDALEGAAASIRRWAPKLAVAAYHIPDHLWRVPAKIRSLRKGYQIYFRQHDGGIIETVTYALSSNGE